MQSRVPVYDARVPPSHLTVVVEDDGGRLLVQLAGELDLAAAERLATNLKELIEASDSISLDLARVTFIDLTGLRVLLVARHDARCRAKRLHVAVPGDACARLIELTETAPLLQAV